MPPLKGEVSAKRAEGFSNADLGRFNLWRPTVVDRTGANRWVQAPLPDRQQVEATPTEVFREIPKNRRIRELQFMVPEFVIG